MKPSTLLALFLIVVGVVALTRQPRPDPEPTPDRPSDTLRAAVGPVVAILKDHPDDGRRLAAFYSALADVTTRDQGKVIQTSAQLRELARRAGLLAFQRTGIVGKYPGLAEAIDRVLADHVGLDNAPLDAERRKRAVDTFKALAWACGGDHA